MSALQFKAYDATRFAVSGPDGVVELSGGPTRPMLTEHSPVSLRAYGHAGTSTDDCVYLTGPCWADSNSILGLPSYLRAYRAEDLDVIENWLYEEYAGLASLVRQVKSQTPTG